MEKARYVVPGIIWQVYDPPGAAAFLRQHGRLLPSGLADAEQRDGRVLLIDEIDKGDLDFANDLLDVFGKGRFDIPTIGGTVERKGDRGMLVVITSNGERDLSKAFVRRCISHQMKAPQVKDAAEIGSAHLRSLSKDMELLDGLRLQQLAGFVTTDTGRGSDAAEFNVAEFVDLIDATIEFRPTKDEWPVFAQTIQQFAEARRRDADASVPS